MATGDRRVQAFLNDDPFTAIVKRDQAPATAVAQRLKRLLGADVQLWPDDLTSEGRAYRAQWFDSNSDRFREARVEIWRL